MRYSCSVFVLAFIIVGILDVGAIDGERLKDIGEPRPAGELKVTCYTCHRGETRPLTRRPDR